MVAAIPAVIWTYIEGLIRHDVARISETVSDDLAFVTATTRLTKDQFLQMLRAIYTGFPDWQYDHDPPELRGTTVAVRWQQGGTHTGTFTLPGMCASRRNRQDGKDSVGNTSFTSSVAAGSSKSARRRFPKERPGASWSRSVSAHHRCGNGLAGGRIPETRLADAWVATSYSSVPPPGPASENPRPTGTEANSGSLQSKEVS